MQDTVPNTLPKEIARLYQLGKKPMPYASNLSTMAMMLLYLNHKYGIEDKTLMQIKENYRNYGRFTKRQKTLRKAPEFYNWELLLYYDGNDRLIKSNRDEYYPVFYWKLRNMIDENPGQKIFCSFDISFYVNDKPDNGHIELVVYDPVKNTLEHVDSNQLPKHVARKERGYFECCQITESILREVAEVLPTSPKYINNHDYYGAYDYGIQSMEAGSDLLVDKEKEGFCLMWMSLFAELALTFPDIEMKDIIHTMIHKAKSIHVKVETENDYFLYVIRGYVVDISRQLDMTFTDEDSVHNACVRLANL